LLKADSFHQRKVPRKATALLPRKATALLPRKATALLPRKATALLPRKATALLPRKATALLQRKAPRRTMHLLRGTSSRASTLSSTPGRDRTTPISPVATS